MGWSITFSVDETEEYKLIHLPEPTSAYRSYSGWSNKKVRLTYHYYIQSLPNTKEQWQMLASIKEQLKEAFKTIALHDEHDESASGGDGKTYYVKELKRYFPKFVKFPTPHLDGNVMEILGKHAKRLHYEGKLHLEQLMFLSWWCAEILPKREMLKPKALRSKKDMATGVTQIMKRAVSCMEWAQEKKDGWKVKLNADELRQAHSRGAAITNQKKRDAFAPKAFCAHLMKYFGHNNTRIADLLDTHRNSVGNWLKTKCAPQSHFMLEYDHHILRYPIGQQRVVHFSFTPDYTVLSKCLDKN